MRPLRRRRVDVLLVLLASVVVGVIAVAGGAVGDSERVAAIHVTADLTDEGHLQIREVIDYDFGLSSRRGIFRDVVDLDPASSIDVYSPSAPDGFVAFDTSSSGQQETRIRIGDPDITINGRHRYAIDFRLDGLVRDGKIGWDAVGTEWEVPIENVTIEVRSELRLTNVNCVAGSFGSWGSCDAFINDANSISITASGLGQGKGVTIYADVGEPSGVPFDGSTALVGDANDPGLGPLAIGGLGALATAAGWFPALLAVRRLGRERVFRGGPTDAAFATSNPLAEEASRVDLSDLADMATISFAPPDGISPAEGGIVFAESVPTGAMTAWLLERVSLGELELVGEAKELSLERGAKVPGPEAAAILNKMFGQRDRIDLTSYDKKFATGWQNMGRQLRSWQSESPLWEAKGKVTQTRVRAGAVVLGLLGLAVAALGGAGAARWGMPWPIAVVAGGLLAGAAVSSMVSSWELLVRSGEGSAMWLQIESFRRFLEESEAHHVMEAARVGRLREYTAWAVSLGETKAWSKAVDTAAEASPEFRQTFGPDIYHVHAVSHLRASASKASTSPSSSGSSGGGVGGGSGGGGGGSW